MQKREENLLLKIVEQDKKRKELEEEKKKVNEKAEEYNRLIAQFKQEQELLKQKQEQQEEVKEKEGTDANAVSPPPPPPPPPSMVRPPRVKVFSFPKLIQRLWGKDAGASSKAKVDSPLPNRMTDMRAFRRITSSPANSREKRRSFSSHQSRGHKRRSSDEMGYKPAGKQALFVSGTCNGEGSAVHMCLATVDGVQNSYCLHTHLTHSLTDTHPLPLFPSLSAANTALKTEVHYLQRLSVDDSSSPSPIPRRESLPSSPSSVARNNHQPVISGSRDYQKSPFNSNNLRKELDKKSTRQRSWSDLRSPSPQPLLLPSYNCKLTLLLGACTAHK